MVLDGQQRLTSLFLLTLKGNFVLKMQLMDLYLTGLSGEDEDEMAICLNLNFSQKKKKMFLLKIIKLD